MTMLAAVENTRIMTLADYEARIYLYREQIGTGYIGIGRTLLDAKEAKVVPHGEWETWVERTTGLNIQQAQRCMKAAREIKDGSALASLEMSKAIMLLASGLDEETQETIARQAADEGATVKQLRAEIEEYKKDLEWTRQAAANGTKEVTAAKLEALEAREAADGMKSALDKAQQESTQLRGQLEGVKEFVAQEKEKAATAVRETMAQEITELRDELAAAEAREEKRAEQLEALRREHQQRAMDNARSLGTSTLSGFDLAAAVRQFIGTAGVLPQMGSTLHTASAAERETIRQNIETVAKWVEGARMALGIIAVADDAIVVK